MARRSHGPKSMVESFLQIQNFGILDRAWRDANDLVFAMPTNLDAVA
jgi:hypothetical protein